MKQIKLTLLFAILFFLAFTSCKPKIVCDCNRILSNDTIGFMDNIGIFSKYDGNVFKSIVHIVDPKDWDYNEYFTGNGFSKNKDDELKVLEKDSCELKQKYFEYLELVKNNHIY